MIMSQQGTRLLAAVACAPGWPLIMSDQAWQSCLSPCLHTTHEGMEEVRLPCWGPWRMASLQGQQHDQDHLWDKLRLLDLLTVLDQHSGWSLADQHRPTKAE